MRQFDAAVAVGQVLLVNRLHPPEMFLQGVSHGPRHRRDPVFVALRLADGDFPRLEVQILYPQAERLQEPQAAAVQQHRDQPLVAGQVRLTRDTSSTVRTTGSRFGRRARTTPSMRSSGCSKTCS